MSFRLALTDTARFATNTGARTVIREQAKPDASRPLPVLANSDALARIRAVLGN